tara:strand:+ start:105 stop:497 length:393 start_codon:yes stop_codon:yes gene_type:complete
MKTNNKDVTANTQTATKVKLDLTKSTFNTSTKSSSINPNSRLIVDLDIAAKYAHELRGQVAIICELAKQNGGSVNLQEANDLWIEQFVDTGTYKQDLVEVSSHYLGLFNSAKGYKKIPSADLKQLLKRMG